MSTDLSGLSGQSSGRSPGLTLNLSSNNPFRNRAASPNGPSPSSFSHPPHSPFDDPPVRPVSRNPFLDPNNNPQVQTVISPDSMSSPKDRKSPTAEELFDHLAIEDKSGAKPHTRPDGARGSMRPPGGPPRGENIPPKVRGPPPSHRPTRSQEEALRVRRAQRGNRSNGAEKIFDSPEKHTERRPRRNSESSMRDPDKPTTDEEKKEREMRRRDRERRHRDLKDKSGRPSKKLDLIDQLDATSIYGTGLFHHDGPFDALNPHRNRKGSRRAPMEAFPKGSLNNSLGGSGPLNARPDHATFMGKHDEEAFKDYSVMSKDGEAPPQKRNNPPVFDPLVRGSIVHGDESVGLGTSTFLEGTPAARTAIQQSAQETLEQGLQRKKSLAQRIRGINRGPRDYNNTGRMTNPDAYGPRSGDLPTSSSAGERNPFFDEYGNNEEQISVKRKDHNAMSPGSPENSSGRGIGPGNLERRSTTDASATSPTGVVKPPSAGLLARVKSLKGGRRQRPEPPQGLPSYIGGSGTAA